MTMALNLTNDALDLQAVHTAVNGGYTGFDLIGLEALQIPFDGFQFHGSDYDT